VVKLIPKIAGLKESILKKKKRKKRSDPYIFSFLNIYFIFGFIAIKVGTSKTISREGKATSVEKKARRN
jgi:hypothetical protein